MGKNTSPSLIQSSKIADLERQLELIRQSASVTPGNLQNQIDGMAMLMLSVARILKLPQDKNIRDLPAWCKKVMAGEVRNGA